jgi:glutamate-1-semialdehyde 2,1-aminomutase
MAAALATLDVLEAENGPEHMRAMGQRFRDGIAAQAAKHGVGVRQSGPPQMPTILFDDDPDYVRGSRFASEALQRGVYLHPKHNMFLSLAHKPSDIDFALSVTDDVFKIVADLK